MSYLRKYGVNVGATGQAISVPIVKASSTDFALSADWTPIVGDVKVTKNDGTPANIATLPTYYPNQGWGFIFSATEMECRKLDVLITDSATKTVQDQYFTIETYGHASAMFVLDYSATIGSQVWSETTRTLSSFGTLVTDIATAVWAETVRTLTAFAGFGLASEANATANKDEILVEIDVNEDLLNIINLATGTAIPDQITAENLVTNTNIGLNKDEIDLIVAKLPAVGNMLSSSEQLDGQSVGHILQLAMAMFNGRFKKNFPSTGKITFYERNNSTVLTVVDITTDERTRDS